MNLPEVKALATELAVERLSCESEVATELVLIHGWGADRSVWNACVPALRSWTNITLVDLPGCGESPPGSYDLVTLLNGLAAVTPERALLMGWSLGGMIATAFSTSYPERVTGLITLACSPRFTQADDWTEAMSEAGFHSFTARVAGDAGRGLEYFDRLQCGTGPEARRCRNLLTDIRTIAPARQTLLDGLGLLAGIDNRHSMEQIEVPVLHLYGADDLLVPATMSQAIADFAPGHDVAILPGATHLLPVANSDWFTEQLQGWIANHFPEISLRKPARLDKNLVAESFSRAAKTYNQHARLQSVVSENLLSRSRQQTQGCRVENVLDLGCGTAQMRAGLTRCYPHAEYFGLDIAEGMLAEAQCTAGSAGRDQGSWICADAEELPLASNSIDLVFTSLAIQWCQDLDRLFAELHRVLRVGGWCFFATLGPGTLEELRRAWLAVDDKTHVNQFIPITNVSESICNAGLIEMQLEQQMQVMRYQELRELTGELKGIGAHNVNEGRPTGLMGRSAVRQLRAAYENQREEGMLPATYQVIYGAVRKPESA